MSCIAPGCHNPRELGAVFCTEHLTAPAGRRGGWLSAERRRRMRGASVTTPLDASNIARRLWVGGKPPIDRDLPEFDMLVLCAEEIQPKVVSFSKYLLRCPIPDGALTMAQTTLALGSGRAVANALTRGKTVLVTCAMGINRSALVAALGLGLITSLNADQLLTLLRARRNPDCLSNPHFQQLLHRYIGHGRQPVSTRRD